MAEFFAGVLLLQSQPGLPAGEKAKKFSELERLTGISAEKALTILALYRDKPAEWRKLCDAIMPFIPPQPLGSQVSERARQPINRLPGARR